MKKLGLLLMVGLIVGIGQTAKAQITPTDAECRHTEGAFNCVNFVSNYDGDTFRANIPRVHPLFGHNILVRINGIDAPERNGDGPCEQSAAVKAQEFLRDELTKARKVALVAVNRDKYFRVLADVQVDGKSIAQEMLRRRLAAPYDGGTKKKVNWCRY